MANRVTEDTLREMIAEAERAEAAAASRTSLMDGLFAPREWPRPPPAPYPRLEKPSRRGDMIIAAVGIALGLTCALFPWYIFYNQEKFGVQTIRLGGDGNGLGRSAARSAEAPDAALTAEDVPTRNLDLFATGTVPDRPDDAQAASQQDQPFPGDAAAFRLVHIANGRAMIEDDAGLWIVQQGSLLPDSSTVRSIEKRGGSWVLVTSTKRVIELSK